MLKALVFLPVVGAALLAVVPARRALPLWQGAMAFALAALAYALWLATQFDPAGSAVQMFESRAWNVRLGSYFALGVDGISLAMVLLAALLTLIAVLVSRRMEEGARLYFILVLLLESAMFGVFTARDWSLFYVFWEATLIPLFFLIDRLGGPNRQRAALNFFLYTLGGSVFMLVALLFLYDAAPGHSFAMADMAAGGRELPLNTQLLIFAGLFIGFGVKMPVFPLPRLVAAGPRRGAESGIHPALRCIAQDGRLRPDPRRRYAPRRVAGNSGLAGHPCLHQSPIWRHPGVAAAGPEGDGRLFVDFAHGGRAARHRHPECHRFDRGGGADGGARADRRHPVPDRRSALSAHAQSRSGRLRFPCSVAPRASPSSRLSGCLPPSACRAALASLPNCMPCSPATCAGAAG